MDLEEKLLSEYGNKCPFKLPKDYFDNLNERIMTQIEKVEHNTKQHKTTTAKFIQHLHPLIVAASFVGLIVLGATGTLLFQEYHSIDNIETKAGNDFEVSVSQKQTESSVLDEAEEYLMIDQDDLYNYLADN